MRLENNPSRSSAAAPGEEKRCVIAAVLLKIDGAAGDVKQEGFTRCFFSY